MENGKIFTGLKTIWINCTKKKVGQINYLFRETEFGGYGDKHNPKHVQAADFLSVARTARGHGPAVTILYRFPPLPARLADRYRTVRVPAVW